MGRFVHSLFSLPAGPKFTVLSRPDPKGTRITEISKACDYISAAQTDTPVTSGVALFRRRSIAVLLQKSLCIQGGHTARARAGDGLSVRVVLDVTRREHSGD